MAVTIHIRPFQTSDQPGVEWLYSRTPPWGRTYPRPEPVPQELKRIADACEHAVVAVEQDRAGEAVIGFVALTTPSPPGDVPVPEFIDRSRSATRLRWVLVAPERWRQGIGSRLVNSALDWSREQGDETIFLGTTSEQDGAVFFYRALGFHEAGRTTFRDWEIVWFTLTL